MTFLARGRIVACDRPSCVEDFEGTWQEAKRAGWVAPLGVHLCPACVARTFREEQAKAAQLRAEAAQADKQRAAWIRRSKETAQAFADLVRELGGPTCKVWSSERAGVRVYFPGNAGYLVVSGRDIHDKTGRTVTFYPSALFPAWKRVVVEARKRFRAG